MGIDYYIYGASYNITSYRCAFAIGYTFMTNEFCLNNGFITNSQTYAQNGLQGYLAQQSNLSNNFLFYLANSFSSPQAMPNATLLATQIFDNFSKYGEFSLIGSSFYVQQAQQCYYIYNQQQCSCFGTPQYLQEMLLSLNALNVTSLGIFTSQQEWAECDGTNVLSVYNLYYQNLNNQSNFNDFIPYGGWTAPTVKQYEEYSDMCDFLNRVSSDVIAEAWVDYMA